MKKDNFDNATNNASKSDNDMSSLLNIFKMLSSNKNSNTPVDNATVANTSDEKITNAGSPQVNAPISRTTERILSLMNEHDKAMKRIDERHNK